MRNASNPQERKEVYDQIEELYDEALGLGVEK